VGQDHVRVGLGRECTLRSKSVLLLASSGELDFLKLVTGSMGRRVKTVSLVCPHRALTNLQGTLPPLSVTQRNGWVPKFSSGNYHRHSGDSGGGVA